MPTTEILVCPLVAGSEIGDPGNPAAQILKEVGQTLSTTDGVQQINFGMQVENPNTFQLLVNWDKLDDHKAFMQSNVYPPFLQRFMSLVDNKDEMSMIHADLKPDGAVARTLSAPVTEVATLYFDGGPPSNYMEGGMEFIQAVEDSNSDGYMGAAIGLTYEEIEREGVKGKGVVLCIGWESVDKHKAFRETPTFKEHIQKFRQGAAKVEMHHVAFLNYVA